MKILFVLEQLNIGGPQKSLLGLLEHIDCEKNDIDVLLLQNEGKLCPYLGDKVNLLKVPDIVDAFTFPVKRVKKTLFTFWHSGGIKLFLSALSVLIKHAITKNCMNVQRQKFWIRHKKYLPILENEYDIAFGYSPVMSTYYVVDCVNAHHKCHWVRCDYRILDMDKQIEAEYFSKTSGIVAVSKKCRDIFVEEFPFAKERATFFYNFIPISFYKSLPDIHLIPKNNSEYIKLVTIARIDMHKGLDMVLDACLVLKEKISFIWYIIGDGPSRKYYENKAIEMGISDHLLFLGFQLNMPSCLKQCDIFVLPSRTEGKSNAVDEAKYYGMPIVITNYPTATEQITDGETGLICEMNGEAIARSILRIVSDKKLMESLCRNCMAQRQLNETPDHLFERIVKNEYMEDVAGDFSWQQH